MPRKPVEDNILQFRDITPRGRESRAYRMRDIDQLEGGRDNLLLVIRANPKKLGTRAYRNYGLYGEVGSPSVSVAEFFQRYPSSEGGVARARISLLWDLNHSLVRIVDRHSVRQRRAA